MTLALLPFFDDTVKAGLSILTQPVWVFDIDRQLMVWGNTAAVKLWGKLTLDDLLSHDFSDASKATRTRLEAYQKDFLNAKVRSERWTFYPGAQPRVVDCDCSGIMLEDGRCAMLVLGREITVDPSLQLELRMVEALRHTGVMISLYSIDGIPLMRNPAATRVFGDTSEGRNLFDCFAEKSISTQMKASFSLSSEFSTETKVNTKLGITWHGLDARVVNDPANGKQAILVNEKDISASKIAEQRQQLAASVFIHAREGIIITDADNRIIDINDAFTQITGFSRGQVIGKNPHILKSDKHSPEYYANMWKMLNTDGYWVGEIWNRRCDGKIYAERLTISTVKDSEGKITNYVALFNDITEIKEKQLQLEHAAQHDVLTGLPNRALLLDRLTLAMVQCQQHSKYLVVAYLDLDGFKQINDLYGHQAGDELLITQTLRLKTVLRAGDTLARIGGDEFIAVLTDLNTPCDFKSILERMIQTTSEPLQFGNNTVNVSSSIGGTVFPLDSGDAEQLLSNADEAMYIAKRSGKNRYHIFNFKEDLNREMFIQL